MEREECSGGRSGEGRAGGVGGPGEAPGAPGRLDPPAEVQAAASACLGGWAEVMAVEGARLWLLLESSWEEVERLEAVLETLLGAGREPGLALRPEEVVAGHAVAWPRPVLSRPSQDQAYNSSVALLARLMSGDWREQVLLSEERNYDFDVLITILMYWAHCGPRNCAVVRAPSLQPATPAPTLPSSPRTSSL